MPCIHPAIGAALAWLGEHGIRATLGVRPLAVAGSLDLSGV
jgi:hypothetical protein